jgi:hypothetical protein
MPGVPAYSSRLLECDGKTQTFEQWSLETGIPVQTLYRRIITMGWTIERSLQTPVRRYRPPVKINGWHAKQETRGEALKRLKREGRHEEFCMVRNEILGRWLTARKKIKKIELFYATLEQFPPLEE